mgnify:CR=1 FL=1
MKFIGQKGQDEWIIDTIFNYKKGGYFNSIKEKIKTAL